MVVDGEGFRHTVFYLTELSERQVALIELSILESFHRDVVYGSFNFSRSGFCNRADGGFDGVGEHNDCGLFGSGLWSSISERAFGGFGGVGGAFFAVFFLCLVVKVFD